MITATVNGQPKQLPEGTTIAGLLKLLELLETAVAIEVNKRLVRSAKYDTVLADGDVVEVVTFVGGG